MIERRELFKKVGLTAVGVALATRFPEHAWAEGDWQPTWGFWRINWPEPLTGVPDERVKAPLLTAEGNTVAITCGPVFYRDRFGGPPIDFKGGEDRASCILIKGPVGSAIGGVDLDLMVLPIYNWVGVTANPNGQINLEQVHVESIIWEREASLRSGDFKGSILDVGVIDGRTGAIEEQRLVYPKRS